MNRRQFFSIFTLPLAAVTTPAFAGQTGSLPDAITEAARTKTAATYGSTRTLVARLCELQKIIDQAISEETAYLESVPPHPSFSDKSPEAKRQIAEWERYTDAHAAQNRERWNRRWDAQKELAILLRPETVDEDEDARATDSVRTHK